MLINLSKIISINIGNYLKGNVLNFSKGLFMKKFAILFIGLMASCFSAQATSDCRSFTPCPTHSCFSTEMFENARPYVGAFAAANFLHVNKHHGVTAHFHPGYALGIAAGYRLDAFRGEFEVAYRRTEIKKIHVNLAGIKLSQSMHGHGESLSFMVNGYYDIPLDSCFTPYIGLGCGYSANKHNAEMKCSKLSSELSSSAKKSYKKDARKTYRYDNFAWQAIAGVSMPICEQTEIALEYRYFRAMSRAHQQNIGVSARYSF